jgi:thymidine kinase
MTIHNYESQGREVLVFKPTTDTRSSKGKIESRIGLSHDCIDIDKDFNIYDYVRKQPINHNISAIICDEIQFVTQKHILELVDVVDKLNINVICYGLKNTYIKGKLFPAIETLLYYADDVTELKSICSCKGCERKSTQNLRIVNGKPVYDGETVQVGDVKEGDSYYMSVCRWHYFNPVLK